MTPFNPDNVFPKGETVLTKLQWPGEWVRAEVVSHDGDSTTVLHERETHVVPTHFMKTPDGSSFWEAAWAKKEKPNG